MWARSHGTTTLPRNEMSLKLIVLCALGKKSSNASCWNAINRPWATDPQGPSSWYRTGSKKKKLQRRCLNFDNILSYFRIERRKLIEHFAFLTVRNNFLVRRPMYLKMEFYSTLTSGSKRGHLESMSISDNSWNAFKCVPNHFSHSICFTMPEVFHFNL